MNTFGLEKLKENSVCLEISFFPWIKIVILPIDPPSAISTFRAQKYFYHLRPSLFLSRAAELGSIPLIDYILHHYSFNPRTLSDIFIKNVIPSWPEPKTLGDLLDYLEEHGIRINIRDLFSSVFILFSHRDLIPYLKKYALERNLLSPRDFEEMELII